MKKNDNKKKQTQNTKKDDILSSNTNTPITTHTLNTLNNLIIAFTRDY